MLKYLVMAASFALLSMGAMAQGFGGMHGGGHGDFFDGPMLGFFADYLDLTDAQQAQIKQIRSNTKPAMEPLFQQERQSREQMRQLVESGSFDQVKAQAIASQEAQVHAQIEVQQASMAAQAYQVLTAEQKIRLKQFMEKRAQRWAAHHAQPDAAPAQQ